MHNTCNLSIFLVGQGRTVLPILGFSVSLPAHSPRSVHTLITNGHYLRQPGLTQHERRAVDIEASH
jgi:hypothetical protein